MNTRDDDVSSTTLLPSSSPPTAMIEEDNGWAVGAATPALRAVLPSDFQSEYDSPLLITKQSNSTYTTETANSRRRRIVVLSFES